MEQELRRRLAEVLRAQGVPEHEIAERLDSPEVAALVAELAPVEPPKVTIQRVDSRGETWFEVVDRNGKASIAETVKVERGDVKQAHDRAIALSQKYGGARPWGDI